MPVVVLLLLGVWEIGRLIEISMTLQNAARVGARDAAGGVSSNGTPVTVPMVQTEVQNYLQSAGFSSSVAQSRLGHPEHDLQLDQSGKRQSA